MRNREIREARINDAATKIRVFFLSFLLETVFVEPARTRYTKVSTVTGQMPSVPPFPVHRCIRHSNHSNCKMTK